MARGTADERAQSLAPDAVTHLKIEVQDADGTWRDYSDRNAGGRVGFHRDAFAMSATVRLAKGLGEDALSPLVEQSLRNRNAAGAYAPAVDRSRLVRVRAATLPAGVPPVDVVGGDYHPIFEGRVDRADQGDDDVIDLACSGKSIFIAQKQIRDAATYGAPGGTLRETVIQQLLDANPNGKWAPTVVVPTPSGSYLTPVEIPMGMTFEAALKLANDIGWDLRERFDANGVLQLMFYPVDRARVTVDAVIQAHEKYRLSSLTADVEPIRTALRLWYRNSAGVLAYVEYTNPTAFLEHGDRWAQVPEQLGIDTASEAQTLVDTIGHDMSGPGAEFAATIPFAWWLEIHDRLTFKGEPLDAPHHDTDQTIAAAGFEHAWDEQGEITTQLTGTARIVGAYEAWHRRILPPTVPENAPTIEPRVEVSTDKTVAQGYAKLTSPANELVTLQVKASDASGAAVWSLCVGAADPTPRYVSSGTELGPADWFTDGSTQQQVLLNVALVRDQIVRRYLNAVGLESGLESGWIPVPFDQRGTPYLESASLAFDEATDELKLTVVAGANCASVRFQIADTDDFAAPVLNTVVSMVEGVAAMQGVSALSSDRNKEWFARAIPYNAVSAGGLAGPGQRDSIFIPASETGGVQPPRVVAYESGESGGAVQVTVEGALGAGAAGPLEWQVREWNDYTGTGEPEWPAVWQSSALPQVLNVPRHPRATKHLRPRVRDGDGRITEGDAVDISSARPEVNDNGDILRGRPLSDGSYAARASDTAGESLHGNVRENGGKLVNRLYAKPLAASPDTADSVGAGLTTRVTTNNEAIGGGRAYPAIDTGGVVVAGAVDFSRPYTGKHAGNLPRSSGSAVATSTAIGKLKDSGDAAATFAEDGGKEVRRLLAKALPAAPDTADSLPAGLQYAPVAVGYVDAQLRPKQLIRPGDSTILTAEQVVGAMAESPDNMVQNGGAQSSNVGDGVSVAGPWVYGTGEAFIASGAAAKFGDRAARCTHLAPAYSSTYQDGPMVYAGQVVELGLWVKPDGFVDGGGVSGALLAIVGHELSGTWTVLGSITDPAPGAGTTYAAAVLANATADTAGWVYLQVRARAEVEGRVRVYLVHGYGGNVGGGVYIDGVVARKLEATTTVGGARGAKGLTDDGEVALPLPSGVGQYNAAGTMQIIAKGILSGEAPHNVAVNFPAGFFANPPLVQFDGGSGLTHDPRPRWGATGSGFEGGAYDPTKPTVREVRALGLDAEGFTMSARLRQPAATQTYRPHNFPLNNNLTATGHSTEVTLANAPANNDTYTGHFRVTATADAPPAGVLENYARVTVAVDLDDGGWVEELGVKTFIVSTKTTQKIQTWAHEIIAVTRLNIGAADKLRLRLKSVEIGPGGGSVSVHGFDGSGGDPNAGVDYYTSADNYAPATDGGALMRWIATEVTQ